MKVDTFCQHIGCQYDVVVVQLVLIVGIEVFTDNLELLTAVLG